MSSVEFLFGSSQSSLLIHPYTSCSEDGTVRRFDTRVQGETGILLSDTSFNSVVYNPVLPQQFATADEEGTLLLHDARMAFTKKPKDARDAAVLQVRSCSFPPLCERGLTCFFPARQYTTMLQRAHPNALLNQVPFQPEVSSITFDPSGKLVSCAPPFFSSRNITGTLIKVAHFLAHRDYDEG